MDERFERHLTEDLYVYFEMPGRSFSCAVYNMGDEMPKQAITRFSRGLENRCKRSESLLSPTKGIEGLALLLQWDEELSLLAMTSVRGELVELGFDVSDDNDIEWGLTIWKSLEHHPPKYMQTCLASDVSLFALRRGIEGDAGVEAALDELERQGQLSAAVPMLTHALEEESYMIRQAACNALGQIPEAVQSWTALTKMLSDKSGWVRAYAAEACYRLGTPAEKVIPILIDVLENCVDSTHVEKVEETDESCQEDPADGRYYAALVLKGFGLDAILAKSALQGSLKDNSGFVRMMSALALVNIGETPSSVIPSLLEGLADPAMSVRERVRIAETLLFEFDQPVESVLDTLIGIAGDAEFSDRDDVFRLLENLGPAAAKAKGVVLKAMNADDENTRMLANDVLQSIDPDGTPPDEIPNQSSGS